MRISVEDIWLLTSCMEIGNNQDLPKGAGGMVDSQTLHKVLLMIIVIVLW